MLIRRTPGVTWGPGSWELGHLGWPTTWTLPTSPQKDRPAVLALSLSDFYCDNYPGINSLLSRDYCSNIVIRSWPVLCLLHKCFDTRHCQNAHACCIFTFFMTFDPFEEWLACPNTSVVECGGALLWQNMTRRGGGCVAHTLTLVVFCNKPQWKEKCTNTQTYRCSASMCVGGLCQSTNTHRNCFSIGHFLWSSWSALVETSVRSAEPLLTRLPASSSEQLLTRKWWYNTIPDICQERQERRECKFFGWV